MTGPQTGTPRAERRLSALKRNYDWGCIWCETLFNDDEVVHDHDESWDEPLCPDCPDQPDLAPLDKYLVSEVLPDV